MSIATAPEGKSKNATTPEGEEERRSVISSDLATSLLTCNEDVFRQIFSFHDVLKIRDLIDLRFLIDLRSSCKLFRLSLPPPPLYTVFPHLKHTLKSLLYRLSALYRKNNGKDVPSLLFIEEGEHFGKHFDVNFPISIIGAGREKTTLLFGLMISGSKSNGSVVIEDLTIQGGTTDGLCAMDGMDLIVRRCKVEKFQSFGVVAANAHISCDDVQVVGCACSGVIALSGGTVKLSGENTRIEGNVTGGRSSCYGLHTYDSSSKIQIVTPLTKDTISINNGGGGNCGRSGTIEQISEQVSSGSAGESKSDSTTSVVNSPPPYASTKVSLLGLSFKASIFSLLALPT